MADFKYHDINNVSHGFLPDRPVTQRASIKKHLILGISLYNPDTWNSMNESNLVTFSSFKFNKNSTKPTSSFRNSLSNNSSNMRIRNFLQETNSVIHRNSFNQNELNLNTDKATCKNRKYEFFQIKYSDLLVKKEDNLNHIKKNKFINLIENSQKENTDNIKKSDLRAYGNNQTITKQTKNKFFKQIQEFSQSLNRNYINKKVNNNKPPISIKSSVDTRNLFAFSPTMRKSLNTKTSIINTILNDKSTKVVSQKYNNEKTQKGRNGYILSKLIM